MQNKDIPTIQVNMQELETYVSKSLADMYRELDGQREKWGLRYNANNPYERLHDRFGTDPAALIKEYDLILDKKSKQPSSVRMPIKFVVGRAIDRMKADKMRQHRNSQLKPPAKE